MQKSNNGRNNGNYNSKPVSSARCSTFHNASTGDWFGKGKKHTSPVFFATIVAFTFSAIFSATSFFTQNAYASTLSLSVSDNITATALPTSASGTTAVSDTTATNISISTDNITGYTLSLASSSSSAPALTGTSSSSNTIPSISAETATLDNFTSGTWGYKPTKKVSGSWTDLTVTHGDGSYTAGYYLPGPTTTVDTIDVTNAKNDTANEYNVAVGVKIDASTAIDSYTGSFTVTAVANDTTLYMQNVADWQDVQIPNVGDTVTAVDNRDNEEYLVGRLADGKVWMEDNLRLGGSSTITLTSSDSNVSSDFTLPTSGTVCFSSSSCTGTSGATGTGYTVTAINTNYKNTTTTSYGSGSGKIGTYYNYCAASAGTICTDNNSSDATYDICPKGWYIPSGDSSGEYQALYAAYNSDASSFRSALSTPLSGDFGNGSVNSLGASGWFWSSSNYDNDDGTRAYRLDVTSSLVTPASFRRRFFGNPVRCVAEMPKIPRTVTISVNDSDYGSVSSSSVTQDNGSTIHTSGNIITIGSTTVTATANSGYSFIGWTNNCGATLTADCSIVANFADTVTFDEAYAAAGKSKTSGYYTMQDMTSSICDAVTEDQIGSLIDTRSGNEVYYVGKLADGKCWMLDNLRLGGTSTISLTTSDTNIVSNYTLPASSTWSYSYTTGITIADDKNTTMTSYGSGSGKIGVYYNYCAASAGTICSSSSSSNASYDICPKGWRMPTGGSSGEYQTLYTAYGSDVSSFKSALSIPLVGNFYSSSVSYRGDYSAFWSSTSYDSAHNYIILVGGGFNVQSENRPNGDSMRCVSK